MTETTHAESSEKKGLNFVEEIVVEDLKAGKKTKPFLKILLNRK